MYEQDFQKIIVSQIASLLPGYHVLNFSKRVFYETEGAQADIAIIDKQYREWWVVEVEMANHSLHTHVLPQVRVLSLARYGDDVAEYLAGKYEQLDIRRLRDMMKGSQPRVLVVVNDLCYQWIDTLRNRNISMVSLRPYITDKNEFIYHITGDLPEQIGERFVSECQVDSVVPCLLSVSSPANLNVELGEEIVILFDGGITKWNKVEIANRVWLRPRGPNPLMAKITYAIFRAEDGGLTLIRKG
jgi:hypothetical protein